jgi:adhesin transport system outer membrane protein
MTKNLIAKTLTTVAVGVALNTPAAAQSLKDAVVQTLESHPTLLSSVRRKDAADAAIDVAKGGYYPRLDWMWGTGREHSRNSSTQPTTSGYVHLDRKQEGMILNQMLWDGFGVKSEVDRRRAISDSTAHKTYGTAEEVALQAIDAYLDVLKNRALVGFARDNLLAHQRTFDQVKLRASVVVRTSIRLRRVWRWRNRTCQRQRAHCATPKSRTSKWSGKGLAR